MKDNTIVISLGGSLIVPGEVDTIFLSSFKNLIEKYITKGYKFVFFTGGGSICRIYNKAVDTLVPGIAQEYKDWLGISVTKVNATLLQTIFLEHAYENIISDPYEKIETQKPIVIGSGWKPGWSTDYDAVAYAQNNNINRVINISNISHVYTADPRKDESAVQIEEITWKDYREIIPSSWEAGLHSPFDPIASKLAEEKNINVLLLDGRNTEELEKAILGESFVGTYIHN